MVNAVGLPLQPVVYVPVEPVAAVGTATAQALTQKGAQQQPLPDLPAKAVIQAKAEAASRQGGLGPLMADLAAVAEAPDAPPALRQAAAQVLKLQTPLSPELPAAALRQATAQSGLFLEARLAAAPARPPGPDLKAALLVLRQVLGEAGAPPAAAHAAAAAAPPPPPYRGGPTRGQKPAATTLPQGTTARTAAFRLQQEADAAIAREELFQFASIPETREGGGARWMFEVPFLTPQGTAVAQFEIARDAPEHEGADAQAPVWRTRFSLDLEPLGQVHATLTLSGEALKVRLWAERLETAQRLRHDGDALADNLRALGHEAEVLILPGAPPHAPPASGRLLDQAT